ncbi:MAG: NUDIX hydrolase [Candidatus Micrarchaeaceae archaeon]
MPKKCIVTSCIVIRRGRILLIHHKKLKKWMYPGGHVDANETPLEAVARETKEETGYGVRIVGAMPLGLKGYPPAKELALPFAIMYEDVRYKTGRHMHFDMMYFGLAEGKQGRLAKGESQMLKWVSESEVDGIDTYYSVKKILKYSFRAIRDGRLSK